MGVLPCETWQLLIPTEDHEMTMLNPWGTLEDCTMSIAEAFAVVNGGVGTGTPVCGYGVPMMFVEGGAVGANAGASEGVM